MAAATDRGIFQAIANIPFPSTVPYVTPIEMDTLRKCRKKLSAVHGDQAGGSSVGDWKRFWRCEFNKLSVGDLHIKHRSGAAMKLKAIVCGAPRGSIDRLRFGDHRYSLRLSEIVNLHSGKNT